MDAANDGLTSASVSAFELLRLGRWQPAEQAFAAALRLIDQGPQADGSAPAARPLRVGRAEALMQLGAMAQAERCLREAFPALGQPRPVVAGPDAPDALQAQALQMLGRLRLAARRPADAVGLLRMALAALPPCEAVGSRLSELRARIVEQLAVALSTGGEVEAALALHAQALAVFEHPLHIELARDRAVVLVNTGVGEWLLGRHAAARSHLSQALAVFRGLFDAGSERERADIARTQMNLGSVLTSLGDLDAATAMFDAAAQGYDLAMARAAGRTDLPRLRASRAQTEMNRAYTLFKAGRFDAAAVHYRSARRRYAALSMSQPQLGDDEARTWVNQAHLLAQQGRHMPARRLYARAWQALTALFDGGRVHLAADVANARLGLARMLAATGRTAAAAAHLDAALSSLVELTERGQLQHARAWLDGLMAHAGVLVACASAAAQPMRHGDVLLRLLARPPRHGLGLRARLDAIDSALDRLDSWAATVASAAEPLPWYGGFAGALLSHLLDGAAQVLGESDPDELRSHLPATQALVVRLYRAVQALPQAGHLPADWFLRTRGLRAQRSALAAGGDSQRVALRDLLADLRRLEEEMLGERGDGARPGPAAAAATATATSPADAGHGDQAPAARWRELHARCDSLREQLVKAGRLPGLLRLDARSLAARMRPRRALVMLARVAPNELLAIALHRPAANGSIVTQRALTLDDAEARLDGVALNRLLRQALNSPGLALRLAPDSEALEPVSGGAALALAEQAANLLFEAVANRLLGPLLHRLVEQGLDDLSIVPSADLHLLPYHQMLESTLAHTGGTLSVYPSCGAWAQHQVLDTSVALQHSAPAWAVVAEGLLDDVAPLHWAVLERRLTQRLWAEAPAPLQTLAAAALHADGVTALIGIGHGSAPADNPARTGLRVGQGRVLSAHDLPRIHTCHRVILSCCVLGRVDEVHSEAMGFLSSSFGYGTRFGAGWVIEVPDAEACLFSLAFQFALRRAHGTRRRVDWNQVFHAVRRGIRDGHWPAGLGRWLSTHLPAAALDCRLPGGPWRNRYEVLRDFDGGMFEVPPPSLRRLMPWAVTLGR